jgi:hypothetical protein
LDIPHLNGPALPGGQYLLDALAKKAMPLRYAIAAPSEQEIELYCLVLDIRAVVF